MNARIKQQDDGSLLLMSAQSNEAWAVLNGFSADIYEVEQAADGRYYLAGEVPQASLDDLKTAKRAEIDVAKDAMLHDQAILDVEGVGQVIYDADAITNILGLMQLGIAEDSSIAYILADDSATVLNSSKANAISAAFISYRQQAYLLKTLAYAAIAAASSQEELANISFNNDDDDE